VGLACFWVMSGPPGYPPPQDPRRPTDGPSAYGPGQPGYGPGYYGPPPAYGYGYGFTPPSPDHPKAVPAMVVGIIALAGGVFCFIPLLAAPVAWWLGAVAKRDIDASQGRIGGRGSAQAGFVMGLIGSVLLILGVVALIVFIVIGTATESDY
jgi:hypothetical protein